MLTELSLKCEQNALNLYYRMGKQRNTTPGSVLVLKVTNSVAAVYQIVLSIINILSALCHVG